MLTTGKAILDVANEHSFAVPAFNISDWAMFRGIVEISEETNAPLIVAIHPDEVSHIGGDALDPQHFGRADRLCRQDRQCVSLSARHLAVDEQVRHPFAPAREPDAVAGGAAAVVERAEREQCGRLEFTRKGFSPNSR